jgi:O-methyltransferase
LPFDKTQNFLKKVLPKSLFNLLYRVASRIYNATVSVTDFFYYDILYGFYILTGNTGRRKRIRTIRKILPYTMVGRTGLLATYDIAEDVERKGMDGCIIECGVARGGCSALMALVVRDNNGNRKSWLFDSFEGLPAQTSEDEYEEPIGGLPGDRSANMVAEGYCLGTYEEVEDLMFSRLGFSRDSTFMVKGWFNDTLPQYRDKVGNVSVLRIDGDWYESTRCCLENLFDNVVSGGYIIIDDYWSVKGCRKAVDEFIEKRGLDVELVFDKRGGCHFVKS